MGRPLNCCADCADVFKINKDNGQIVWTKNLGFEATAIYVYEDRIYVATSYYGPENLYTSVYDIVVLDLGGNIIEEECLTFLPKIRLKDANAYNVENTENDDEYRGVDAPQQIISELFIFKHNDSLYVNAVVGACIIQVVDGEIKYITDIRSTDKKLFNNTYLDFSCGESINNIRIDNLSVPEPVLVEFGYDYITFKKPDLPDIPVYESSLPDISPNVLDLVVLSDEIDDTFSYEYIPINTEISPYTKTTDGLTYNTYTFETPVQGIIFPRIDQHLNPQNSYVDISKKFHQEISKTSNGYYNESALDGSENLEPHARIIFGNDKPTPPKLYIARLDLLTYKYEYIEFECANDFDNLKDMIDKAEIENREISSISIAFGDADTKTVFNTRLDKFVFDQPPNVIAGNGTVILYQTPPTPNGTFDCTREIRFGADGIIASKNVNLQIDDSINCGYISDFNDEVFSYDIVNSDGGYSEIPSVNFRYDNKVCSTTLLDLGDYHNGTEGNPLHPNIYDTWRQYVLDNLQCKAKLTSFHFSQISKSYEKANKVIFNAIMVGNWTTYTDIYNIKPTLSSGSNISRDVYIAFRTNNPIVSLYASLRYEYFLVYDLDSFPKDENGNYYYEGGNYVIHHYYREEFSLNLKFYKGKMSPTGYVHTNTKVLISLDKTTNKYTVILDNSDDYDYEDYNIVLSDDINNVRLSRINTEVISSPIPIINFKPLNLFRHSEETELRNITYIGAGPMTTTVNIPITVNETYKYIYRGYEYSENSSYYYPDNLTNPRLINTDGLKFKRSSFANVKLNDNLYSAYTANQTEAYNRLITHDIDSEYVAISSSDGTGRPSIEDQEISFTDIGVNNDEHIHSLIYDYNFESSDDYTLMFSLDGITFIYLECSLENTTTQDIVNFINTNGGNAQVYTQNTLKTGVIAISSTDLLLLPLNVTESPYVKEKYNVFGFTNGQLKWKTNILMPPRAYTDYADDNREYNTYSSDNSKYILDIHQDNDFIYLATSQRRKIANLPVDSRYGVDLGESRLMLSNCGVMTDSRLKNLIDYPNQKMKNV